MAAQVKTHIFSGAHTAGIFSDMSVDGPIIGTLVAIVDRAKNLPNRKTIGKQDPYCAARLGKEAKKTATDVRGGQTPKWDQELRFTVHDCSDYYQLKISVFTDDKRTDLIGEGWIDLKGIIIPGGGQGDVWQGLTCKGKYAGEIRLEMTYYDNRPKPDNVAARPRLPPAANDSEQGSMKQRAPMKRRPLPSDPVTGQAPTPPAQPQTAPPALEHFQTPPRVQPKGPSQSGFIPTQSPLQSIEYQTPPSGARYPQQQVDQYSPAHQMSHASSHSTPPRTDMLRQAHRHTVDSYESPTRHHDEREYAARVPVYQQPSHEPRERQHSAPPEQQYTMGPREAQRHLPAAAAAADAPPPPPPAHRSRHYSSSQELSSRAGYEVAPLKTTPQAMRQGVLRQEAHRQSMPSLAGRPALREYDSAPAVPNTHPAQREIGYQQFVPRHHSHDASYDDHHRSMQPTVEDVPEYEMHSQPVAIPRQTAPPPRRSTHDEMFYNEQPAESSVSLSRSPGASPLYGTSPSAHSPGYESGGYHGGQDGSYAHREYSHANGPSKDTYDDYQPQGHELVHAGQHRSSDYDMPPLPPSLVPGPDPNLALELAHRINERQDRRYSTQNTGSSRGRHMIESPPTYNNPGTVTSSRGHPSQHHERRSNVTYSGGPEPHMSHRRSVSPNPDPYAHQQVMRRSVSPAPVPSPHSQQVARRSVSPNPQHTIRRKSVSPAPPASDRRASEVPFGPDSYNAFNPHSPSPQEEHREDPNAKIITYDGREVDPSDHLPVESWAPEPEAKPQAPQQPRSRPAPAGAQSMPPSGKRQLRIAGRPSAGSSTSYSHREDSHTPPAAGRTRLIKKGRDSMAPAGSSPLGPTPDNYQERQSYVPPGRGHRSSNYGYQNENHAPHYGSGPPLPAKVPIMSGANAGQGDDLALMQEMSSIDIGAGRSRRRGGY